MKTILVPTDFSPAADNAARYALQLAKAIKANIKLCHAFKVPAETPMASQVVWPLEDFTTLKKDTTEGLKLLAEKLTKDDEAITSPGSFHPLIEYASEVGAVTEVVHQLFLDEKSTLVVMGMSGAGGLSRFFLGSTSRDMIEEASFPVLLIPSEATFNGIHKIAFSTDLSTGDIGMIHSLSGLAYPLNAEILVAHVTSEQYDSPEHMHKVDSFLNYVTNKINYPKIYYRHIRSIDVEHGLDWLTEHGQIDMLAMVHRKHNLLERIFEGSYTQRLAKHIELPLLVFPVDYKSII
jgi:nucleotide-binding universal stress UspA family protein